MSTQTNSVYFSAPCLRVNQPIGEFYVATISAEVLLKVTYSDPLRVRALSANSGYTVAGNQRGESQRRLTEIRRYIETSEATFPNSVIIAANYGPDELLVGDEEKRWRVERGEDGCNQLIIPSAEALASIVDGQHRLHAFETASGERKAMDLVCTVFLDLPNPFQAYIFATINFNQKRVDKSLAYEMFGFDLDVESPTAWSPDKLAVFIARKLNTTATSPLKGHIAVAPKDQSIVVTRSTEQENWVVSMATIVDGILHLISVNPRRDKDTMNLKTIAEGRSRKLLSGEKAPLRSLYLTDNDLAIYTAVNNFFTAVANELWSDPKGIFLQKTVGVQALFDLLTRILTERFPTDKNISLSYFTNWLQAAKGIDFADAFQSSGLGRARIRKILFDSLGFV